jgi:hypothetical protein
MTQITDPPNEGDEHEKDRIKAAGEYRQKRITEQQQ